MLMLRVLLTGFLGVTMMLDELGDVATVLGEIAGEWSLIIGACSSITGERKGTVSRGLRPIDSLFSVSAS